MKNIFLAITVVLLTMTGCCCDDAQSVPQTFNYTPDFKALKVDESRLARIDALLQDYVEKGIIPHALTFVAKDGQVIHHKAFGWRDVEKQIPLANDDIFRMYSQTKAVTTVALMTLFEEGKFQLDDPVSKYIPEMTDRVLVNPYDRNDTTTRKALTPVKIRHVLSHTAGIQGPRGRTEPAATLAEYVKTLVAAPLIYDPGTQWNYHPSSDVWARLVEVISGQDLQVYVKEHVLDPLGITDMAYYYPESYKDRFVTMYRAEGDKIVPVEMWSGRYPFGEDTLFANGGTGLNGTIEGYARFCQMILNNGIFNGNRVLGRRTIEIMSKDQVAHPSRQDDDFHFGIGWQIYPTDKLQWNTLDTFSPMVSGNALSWGGMANTDYIIDPKENMIILLYTNRIPDTLVWEKFLNTVYQALE
ncbi:MAG: beta-lactamase family protein [Prevotellaceae bacterium]|jgi:CubicO group peptidase (beta-lactamase class C family)|nr:beta-lactamase family protein [Prevotellaceae bacterium]